MKAEARGYCKGGAGEVRAVLFGVCGLGTTTDQEGCRTNQENQDTGRYHAKRGGHQDKRVKEYINLEIKKKGRKITWS